MARLQAATDELKQRMEREMVERVEAVRASLIEELGAVARCEPDRLALVVSCAYDAQCTGDPANHQRCTLTCTLKGGAGIAVLLSCLRFCAGACKSQAARACRVWNAGELRRSLTGAWPPPGGWRTSLRKRQNSNAPKRRRRCGASTSWRQSWQLTQITLSRCRCRRRANAAASCMLHIGSDVRYEACYAT